MSHYTMLSIYCTCYCTRLLKTKNKLVSVVFTNKVGKNSRYFVPAKEAVVSCVLLRAWKVKAMKRLKSTAGNSRPSTELKPLIRFSMLFKTGQRRKFSLDLSNVWKLNEEKMTLFELMVTPKKGSESSDNPTERLYPFLWMGSVCLTGKRRKGWERKRRRKPELLTKQWFGI